MQRYRLFIRVAMMLVIGASATSASARPVEHWSYKRLFETADLVVIAEFASATDSGETTTENKWKEKMIGVNTTLVVKQALKGEVAKDRITVLHYRLPKGASIINGPSLLTFRAARLLVTRDTAKIDLPKPDYLLFLRLRKDGRYEPVTGQVDSEDSAKEVFPPFSGR